MIQLKNKVKLCLNLQIYRENQYKNIRILNLIKKKFKCLNEKLKCKKYFEMNIITDRNL